MIVPPIKATAGIKIAIGVVAGIVVVVGGFLLIQNVFSKASDTAPRDVIINGITNNTAKISWTTDQETQGVVEYGSSPTSLNLFAPDSQKTKSHSVDITLLSSSTSYYFQIRIGETKYDNGGVPWTFATKAQASAAAGSPTPGPSVGASPVIAPSVEPTAGSAFGPLSGSSLKVNPTIIPTALTPIPALTSIYCVETDCQKICLKIWAGQCSTDDFRSPGKVPANNCYGKVDINNSSCPFITPTTTPTITSTPTLTPTVTPTSTPTSTPAPTPTP